MALLDALTSRQLIDAVLVVAVIEVAALALYRRATGKGPAMADLGANLAAGLCLILAARAAVADAALPWIALPLLGAGVAHGLDMRRRWRAAPHSAKTRKECPRIKA